MARKRKRTKSHHRRRRRHSVGAIDVASIGKKVLGVAAGAFVARTLFNLAAKQWPTLKPQYVGLITIGLGALLPKFMRSELAMAASDGMIAIGALTAMQNFGLISGIGQTRRVQSRIINGPAGRLSNGSNRGNFLKANVAGSNEMHRMAVQGLGALMYEE